MYQLTSLLFPVFVIGILSFVAAAYIILFYKSRNRNYIHYISIFVVSIIYSALEVYSNSLIYLSRTPWDVPDIYNIKSFVIMGYLAFLIFFSENKPAKILIPLITAAFILLYLFMPESFIKVISDSEGRYTLVWGLASLFKYMYFISTLLCIIISSGRSDLFEVVEYSGKLPLESVFFSGFLVLDDFLISSFNITFPLGNKLNIVRMLITISLIIVFALTGTRHTQRRRHVEWLRTVFNSIMKGELDFKSISNKKDAVCWVVNPSLKQIEFLNTAFDRIWVHSGEDLREKYKFWLDSIHEDDFDYVLRSYRSLIPESELLIEYRINTSDGIKWIREKAILTSDHSERNRIFKESHEITAEVRFNERFSGPEYALSVISRKLYLDQLDSTAESYRGFASQVYFSLILLDINHFRDINMVHGNRIGDRVLELVFFQIKNVIRKTDKLFRTNGDNFAVILTAVNRERDVIKIAEKIVRIFREPLEIDDLNFQIHMNMGIALYPSDGDSGEALNKNAELALIHAKKSDAPYVFSTGSINADAMTRLRIIEHMKNSLPDEEFYLNYQPIFTSELRIAGYEALLRWNRIENGFTVQDIIEIAESCNLIDQLGEWIYITAFKNFMEILSLDSKLFLSVNISPVQLQNPLFIDSIKNAAEMTGVPIRQIHLEITETTFMRDRTLFFEKLTRLAAVGFTVSMDDFGTGYSSLVYLRKLPFHVIKLDREFIMELPGDEDACSFFNAAVQMINSSGKRIIIEGVETADQFKFINSGLTDVEYQGYYFSKPLSLTSFTELLLTHRK